MWSDLSNEVKNMELYLVFKEKIKALSKIP